MFELPPKSVYLAPPKSDNSRSSEWSLSSYTRFLSTYGDLQRFEPAKKGLVEEVKCKMAAIFDPADPASPLAYDASQTALVLMDFQHFVIEQCAGGQEALAKAKMMRDWALERKIMVLHSIADISGTVPEKCKSGERLRRILGEMSKEPSRAEEPEEIAFSRRDREYITLKSPGHINGLKNQGAQDLLKQHGIKNLILCGVATSGCVLRTSMPVTDDGYVVSVIEDACADPKVALHDTLVKDVIPSRVHVATAEEFMKQWSGK